ncbi:MAG: ribbon-helix-helix domain-containing protein [Promethearchaeota archaeon]
MNIFDIIESSEIPCTIKIPEAVINKIDELVEEGRYKNRSSFIRTSIKKLLIEEDALTLFPEYELDECEQSKLKKSHKDFFACGESTNV